MHSPATPTNEIQRPSRRWRWIGISALLVLVLIVVLAVVGYFKGYAMGKAWVQSPEGRRVASRGLGKAIKIDGGFSPLHLQGWTVQTDLFQGPGWPGEALAGIQAGNIRAEFDPSAILRRAWRISGIQIDRAVIRLQPPNDALKRPVPPKKPRPWYAIFLPDHFECGPIVAQSADLDFSFQKQTAHIHDAHVQADLIGKDLKYTATSGVLDFPYLPPLRIHRLEMLVTRPVITIDTAQLTGLDPNDPARLTLSGKLGMRENKSIDAHVDVVQMPIEGILPENLRSLIHGRASGKLVWERDSTGKQVSSDGDLSLTGARIDDLSVFRQLTILHDNPDLKDFALDQAVCHFHLENGTCVLTLQARARNVFTFTAKVTYQLNSKVADMQVAFGDLPLQTWLPQEFKANASGVAKANLQWIGKLDTIKDSAGTVAIDLDGAQMTTPAPLRRVLARKHFRAPDQIQFQTAELNFNYQDKTFTLTRGDIALPGILNAQFSGSLSADALLNAKLDWQGLTMQDWLPRELADQFSGDIDGHAIAEVRKWKLANGAYAGDVTLRHGELSYTSVQSILARFTNDRQLLKIPLTRAQFSWGWNQGDLIVQKIDLRGRDDLGVQGSLHVRPNKSLSGTLWIGIKPSYLKSLAGAADSVFFRHEDGLVWAKVKVSGTEKKPEQNLSEQLVAQLKRRPLVVLGLGFKLASWYIGNWFGAADQWKRPDLAPADPSIPTQPNRIP